jgi:hypothetical protein
VDLSDTDFFITLKNFQLDISVFYCESYHLGSSLEVIPETIQHLVLEGYDLSDPDLFFIRTLSQLETFVAIDCTIQGLRTISSILSHDMEVTKYHEYFDGTEEEAGTYTVSFVAQRADHCTRVAQNKGFGLALLEEFTWCSK